MFCSQPPTEPAPVLVMAGKHKTSVTVLKWSSSLIIPCFLLRVLQLGSTYTDTWSGGLTQGHTETNRTNHLLPVRPLF